MTACSTFEGERGSGAAGADTVDCVSAVGADTGGAAFEAGGAAGSSAHADAVKSAARVATINEEMHFFMEVPSFRERVEVSRSTREIVQTVYRIILLPILGNEKTETPPADGAGTAVLQKKKKLYKPSMVHIYFPFTERCPSG